jgi:hypothetical protein
MTRRIGRTTYQVKVAFSVTAQETMEDKILHMIQNDAGYVADPCGIMESPQMSRPA